MATAVATRQQHDLRLERTSHPGVFRRGTRYVAIFRSDGRQHKQTAATFDAARAIKVARDAEERQRRNGPTLHAYALDWARGHVGSGHDTVSEHTRTEYRRLLVTYALRYFDAGLLLRKLNRAKLQGFVSWVTHQPGRNGRLSDQSVHNILAPLRLCLQAAATDHLIADDLARSLLLPRRRGGGPWR